MKTKLSMMLLSTMLAAGYSHAQSVATHFEATDAAKTNYFMGKVGVGTVTPQVGLQVNTAMRALGTVDHTAQGLDRLDVGVQDGSPRIIFESIGYNRYGIDNYLGDFRWWISPTSGAASVEMTLNKESGLHVYRNLSIDGSVVSKLRALGPVAHTAQGLDRLDIGVQDGAPRIIFESVGYNRFGIDNYLGTFRCWISPTSGVASVELTLNKETGLNVHNDLVADGNLSVGGAFVSKLRALGPVAHTAQGLDRLDIGVQDGSPRIIFEDDGFNRWGIDNIEGIFRWWVSPTSGVSSVKMQIDSESGFVGVGTLLAEEMLHVAGAGHFDGGIAYVAPLGDLSMGSFTNAP